jgi:predicted TIM-barrel fold metal-dependent hydrolase
MTATDVPSFEIPRLISPDDHVVEPRDLWVDRLPAKLRERGPHTVRKFCAVDFNAIGQITLDEDRDAPGARWCDVWLYDDMVTPSIAGYSFVGALRKTTTLMPVTYDDMEPGCFSQAERLRDMDDNYTDVSMCFPTISRFCGQAFLERADKDLALECVRVYNDWMIDEWCGGAGHGRLIPLTIIPLWDVELAAAEVRRCAAKGSHSIAFSESPYALGLPSIHSGRWDPLMQACQDTDTVINMHVGSSSTLPATSPDAPTLVTVVMTHENSVHALVDWLLSGALARFPQLRISLSEGQAGWMPFMLERMDTTWERGNEYEAGIRDRVPAPPSSYVAGRVFATIFDDVHGLKNRDVIGLDQLMFEIDYPHADSTFPHSRQTAEKLVSRAGLDPTEAYKFIRGNAIKCYRLDRYGVTA